MSTVSYVSQVLSGIILSWYGKVILICVLPFSHIVFLRFLFCNRISYIVKTVETVTFKTKIIHLLQQCVQAILYVRLKSLVHYSFTSNRAYNILLLRWNHLEQDSSYSLLKMISSRRALSLRSLSWAVTTLLIMFVLHPPAHCAV